MKMNNSQKLEAIKAIINGEWDNKELEKIGELYPGKDRNILNILNLPSDNYPVFIPDGAKSNWDTTEIQPVAIVDDEGTCDVCDEGEEDFWSVYLHQNEGGVICVADVETSEQAGQLAELIDNAVKSYGPGIRWKETYFDVSVFLVAAQENEAGIVGSEHGRYGRQKLYQLAHEWTDEFERMYFGHNWDGADGDYWEELDRFCDCKNTGKSYTRLPRV